LKKKQIGQDIKYIGNIHCIKCKKWNPKLIRFH
jgi:hypothetical protein